MTAPSRIDVRAAAASYSVLVGDGLLPAAGEYVARVTDARRCALVTDATVDALYGDTVAGSLSETGFDVVRIVVPPGEASKSWPSAGAVLEELAGAGVGRSDLIVALGGGVVGDLAGFCAAVYLRGIDYVQLPTTLLAQVDSSVGGKTGVDLAAGKNLAGSFKQPLLVLADTDVLTSLVPLEWQSGLAEVAKTAMLAGPGRVEWMTRHAGALLDREAGVVREAVIAAIEHKASVVSADELEADLRESLNYGHTLGHAIERVAGYGTIAHGVAVAEGMRFAARLAANLLDAPAQTGEIQEAMLTALGIARPAYAGDVEALVAAMHSDKKARGGTVRFALVPDPGRYVALPVGDDVLEREVREWTDTVDERG
ncbi:MAG: 3-dehydroquinate synthase [Anaerosomatales bacterium]|nr:3-dehydroquinate synthase [Anaerosomatales bacterium]MDT8433209.1 3-dehydroquinate synthase [Anaerosomatales bacterium]